MDPIEEIKQTFFVECEELLETLEAGLLAINDGENDDETINAVFRAVHSIKGGAGAFALDNLVAFAHTFETVLDEVRSNTLDADQNVMAVLLKSSDVLCDLVGNARDSADAETEASKATIVELKALMGASGATAAPAEAAPAADEPDADFAPVMLDLPDFDDDAEADESRGLQISITPKPSFYDTGNEITLLLRALEKLGPIETKQVGTIGELTEWEVEKPALSLEVSLSGDATYDQVEEIFEFVDTECDLKLSRDEPAATPATEAEEPKADPAPDPAPEPAAAENTPPTPATAPATAPAQEKTGDASPQKKSGGQSGSSSTVRIDLDRIDRLVNLVGELVINQAAISQCIEDGANFDGTAATNAIEEFKQLTREIQDSVMAIRTQPVKSLFQRMQRIVREAAAATGKAVKLISEGEATEVDKTVIERLADPLTHMIRNAVDHGLENADVRTAAGKDPSGVVRLTAAHKSGRVIIEVADDGKGLDRDRIREIAISKGLIDKDVVLSNSEIDGLLFAPGFSTAKEVSNLSGRGVGMDVVKRAIQSIGGKISISSQIGVGTTFSISLPLTLAVLDGMVVTVDNHTLVVPLTAIVESLKANGDVLHRIGEQGIVVNIRDAFVPVIDLGLHLGFRSSPSAHDEFVVLLIETEDEKRAALVVDSILDQRQVVIKGLENNYGNVPGISAATILGDGSIALIVDTDDLFLRAKDAAAFEGIAA